MLPKNKIFRIKNNKNINTTILKQILETKFQVKLIPNPKYQIPNTSSANLSQIAENIFKEITKGNFKYKTPINAPLMYLSGKELELYAKLKNIKGSKRKQDKKIQDLFKKFLTKNQDLEINILNAQNQINEKTKS